MALKYYERVTTDDESHEMQYVGEISVEGDIIDGDEDDSGLQRVSNDMQRMREAAGEDEAEWEIIDSLINLHTGRNYRLVDVRDPEDITEEELEYRARHEIEQSLQSERNELSVENADIAKRLLASHDDPFPIDAVLLAAEQAADARWVTNLKAEYETSAAQRRYIAKSDALVPVINLLLTGDDPYAGLQ